MITAFNTCFTYLVTYFGIG